MFSKSLSFILFEGLPTTGNKQELIERLQAAEGTSLLDENDDDLDQVWTPFPYPLKGLLTLLKILSKLLICLSCPSVPETIMFQEIYKVRKINNWIVFKNI